MEIRYEVPKHLESYIAPMTEEDLSKLLTVLLDIAVRHRMFEYPSLAIERDVQILANEITSISQSTKLINTSIENYHTALNCKIDSNNAIIVELLETIKNNTSVKENKIETYQTDTVNSDNIEIDKIEDTFFELPDDDDIIY